MRNRSRFGWIELIEGILLIILEFSFFVQTVCYPALSCSLDLLRFVSESSTLSFMSEQRNISALRQLLLLCPDA